MGECILAGFGRGGSGSGGSSSELTFKTEIITEDTVWYPPKGIKDNKVNVLLFGGGGGYVGNSSYIAGGGGGYLNRGEVTINPKESVIITIGRPGSAGTDGGTTSFGSYMSANGGRSAVNSNCGGSGGSGGYGRIKGGDAYQFGGGGSTFSGGNGGIWGGGGYGGSVSMSDWHNVNDTRRGGDGGTYGGGGGTASFQGNCSGGNGGTYGGGGGAYGYQAHGTYAANSGIGGLYGGNGCSITAVLWNEATNGTNTIGFGDGSVDKIYASYTDVLSLNPNYIYLRGIGSGGDYVFTNNYFKFAGGGGGYGGIGGKFNTSFNTPAGGGGGGYGGHGGHPGGGGGYGGNGVYGGGGYGPGADGTNYGGAGFYTCSSGMGGAGFGNYGKGAGSASDPATSGVCIIQYWAP